MKNPAISKSTYPCVSCAWLLHGVYSDPERSLRSPSQQAPDYRLYKSEPELTTVKEEVDEANGEDKDKTETSADSKDTTASKGTPGLSHIKLMLLHIQYLGNSVLLPTYWR